MQKIVLATQNTGKVIELSDFFSKKGCEIISQKTLGIDAVEETGLTFIENALLKARHAALHSGLPAIADDSGLVVKALQGAPGIYSARYAGESASDTLNNQKLLHELRTIPLAERDAYFYCVVVYLQHAQDPTPIIGQGIWHGKIALAPSGEGGFGYDPLFYLTELQCTAAQLSAKQKQQLSHRGKALAQITSIFNA